MSKKLNCCVVFLLLLCLAPIYSLIASQVPSQYLDDQRIRWINYSPSNVVLVTAAAFTATQIVFAHNETIENIQSGDIDAWTVNVQKRLPNMLFLKPTMLGSDTNMTVVTNKRSYYFHLISKKLTNATKLTYAIHFTNPAKKSVAYLTHGAILAGKKNWNYSYSGDKQLLPLRVYDDGRFTYLQLSSHQNLPAIFVVNNRKGHEAVVNFRRKGRMLIIQQVAPQFSLRLGGYHVLSLFNNNYFKR
ncbi:MAG: TrbG/VirB9 family P-type conjugative transfer protein [Coxiellaceae bacterium]|nr:TrbG/VirB9 family P-type conjugative transfer protein [Coxiellaceae bacterium]